LAVHPCGDYRDTQSQQLNCLKKNGKSVILSAALARRIPLSPSFAIWKDWAGTYRLRIKFYEALVSTIVAMILGQN
jgi:hypothetical protein